MEIVDYVKEFVSKWEGWASILAFIVLIVCSLVKKIRDIIINLCAKYILANSRRFLYLITNKSFITTGYIKFSFPNYITEKQALRDEFADYLRNEQSFTNFEGSLETCAIRIRLREIQHIQLILSFETGQEWIDTHSSEIAGYGPVEHGENDVRKGTVLTIKWEKIQLHYREFSKVLNILRQKADDIKDKVAPLINDRTCTDKRTYLEIFYRKDCRTDNSLSEGIKLADEKVSMTKYKGKLTIGAQNIDHIVPYLPKYLVKETLRALTRRQS